SEGWKRGFVFAVAQHQTTINPGEGPPYSTTRAFQRCLSGASDAILEQQVETYVARNPSNFTEPMVVVVIKTLRDMCRSEIGKGGYLPRSRRGLGMFLVAFPPAFAALDAQHIELAFDVAEDEMGSMARVYSTPSPAGASSVGGTWRRGVLSLIPFSRRCLR